MQRRLEQYTLIAYLATTVALFFLMVLFSPAESGSLRTQLYAPRHAQEMNPLATLPKPEPIILFAGDMMLGRTVETKMNQQTIHYPFEKISPLLKQADLAIANLEGPILTNHVQTPVNSVSFSFNPTIVPAIKESGIDLVALGNNHTSDKGEEGFLQTKQYLENEHILSVGHAISISPENNILTTTIQDASVRLYSFNVTFPFIDEQEAITLVQDSSDDSFDIVMIHWGTEYKLTNSPHQQELAHQLIDAGADLIIGHHPHVVQTIEEYNGVLIFYSLGNFIFDQYFSQNTQEGLVVVMSKMNETEIYKLIPIDLTNSQPKIINDSSVFLEQLAQRSDNDLFEQIKKGVIKK